VSANPAIVESIEEIPVIDFGRFLGGTREGKASVAAAIRQAAETIGFLYLSDHGIPQGVIENTFETGRQFFALPPEAKLEVKIREQRGYQAFKGVQRPGYLPNLNESFFWGVRDLSPDDPDVRAGLPLHAPNQWPSAYPQMRAVFEDYAGRIEKLGGQLLRACALALEIDERYFEAYYRNPVALVRIMHYPASSEPRPENQFGNPPHTDYGCITLLAQDEVGGLAVRRRGGGWIEAPSLPGTYVINIADMLMRWTNDRWVSTPHRVINDPGRSRYSLPTFFDPDYRAKVACIESCQGPGNPAKYPPITFGEYYREGLDKTYGYRKDPAA
jgi:isopenicillin N synthase-like dioxygenase